MSRPKQPVGGKVPPLKPQGSGLGRPNIPTGGQVSGKRAQERVGTPDGNSDESIQNMLLEQNKKLIQKVQELESAASKNRKYEKEKTKQLENEIENLEEEMISLKEKLKAQEKKNCVLEYQLTEARRTQMIEKEHLETKIHETNDMVLCLAKKLKDAESTLEKPRGGNNTSSSAEGYKRELDKANIEIAELQVRLSKVAEARLMDCNPNIVDLPDPYRPTKLADKYMDIYNSEWTDAYEEIAESGKEDEEVVKHLLETLKKVYKFCQDVSKEHENGIATSILTLPGCDEGKPSTRQLQPTTHKQIVALRKAYGPTLVEDVVKQYLKTVKTTFKRPSVENVYVEKCVEICWLMSIQDPPVVLDTDDPKGAFDGDRYRTYYRSGKTFDYVVWPPIRLQKAGPLLGKGVAQGKN